MEVVRLSPKFQVVIPKAVREAAHLEKGQHLGVAFRDGRIELVPLRPAREYMGFLKGMANDFEREADREL